MNQNNPNNPNQFPQGAAPAPQGSKTIHDFGPPPATPAQQTTPVPQASHAPPPQAGQPGPATPNFVHSGQPGQAAPNFGQGAPAPSPGYAGQAQNLTPQAQPPVYQQPNNLKEYLTFQRMITPVIIQVIFWLGVAGSVFGGLAMLSTNVGMGLAMVFLGPIAVRLYTELVMLGFRSYDALKQIAENTRR